MISVFNTEWLYTPISYLDPWYNVGHFMHYVEGVFWPGHYKETRLSWIAPGYAIYQMFGPVVGNYVLHMSFLLMTCVFTFLFLNRIVGIMPALLATILLQIYFPLHKQFDYQNIGAAAYYAMSAYFCLRAGEYRYRQLFLFAAGFSFGAAFHTNILVVNMVPVLALLFVMQSWHRTRHIAILPALAWAAAGFVAVTALLCAFAWLAGRPVLFFWPIVEIVLRYTVSPSTTQAGWWLPWSTLWFTRPEYLGDLVVLVVIFVAGVLWLVKQSLLGERLGYADEEEKRQLRLFLVGLYVFLFLLWCFWQTLGQTALQPYYFAHPLIVPAFMALPVLLGRVGRSTMMAVYAIIVFVFLFSEVTVDYLRQLDILTVPVIHKILLIAALLTVVVAFGLQRYRNAVILGMTGLYLSLYAGLGGPRAAHSVYVPWSYSHWAFAGERCIKPSRAFDEVVRINQKFRGINPIWWQTWVWGGPAEEFSQGDCLFPLAGFRGSLISTGMSGLGGPNDTSPAQITDEQIGFVSPGGTVALITRDEANVGRLTARFAASGKRLEPLERDEIDIGQVKARLYIFKAYPIAP